MKPGPRARACSVRAFTLVEVLVSLAIFGMATVVLGSAYVNVLQSYESIRKDQVHEAEIDFVFSRILSLETREDFEAGGSIETLHEGHFNWEARLEPTGVADLFRAEVRVNPPGRTEEGRRREVTRTFIVFRPGWQDADERARLREETRERLEDARRFRENGGGWR